MSSSDVADLSLNDPSITKVDLSYKFLGSKGSLKVASGLAKNEHIKEINLAGNEFCDNDIEKICKAILGNDNTSLEEINLCDNEFTVSSKKIIDLLSNKFKINIKIPEFEDITVVTKRKGKKRDKTEKRKSKKYLKKTKDKKKDDTEKEKRTSLQSEGIIDTRKKVMESQINMLKLKEEEYLQQIEELESRCKDLSKGRLTKINSRLFSPKKSKSRMTVSTKSIIITQKISEGGGSSAEIYSCIVDGWLVVMKELSTSSMGQQSIENFSKEIRLLELLPPHENIARYLFHEVKDRFLRLFITHYDCSLAHYIKTIKNSEEPKIPVRTIYKILLDIVRGIEFLHSHNIMHRDLKSDNIFILFEERKEIKLCAIGDFDSAKQGSNTKTVLGTPSWMAPEVMSASSSDGYSFPCDVYSFGMILYELLTLTIPFSNMNAMKIPILVMGGTKPKLPEDLGSEYSELISLFNQCSEFNPEDRPVPAKLKTLIALGMANH